ncbi:protein PLASTID MOVEMENT IMPAIRED 1-RELATED 1 [Diospyros lotus]|uniref:protein PLASTID MOVEMENT IMPAIRED 1-RELATED 1 n=1 Tax=Diospyros lotus TaxID=55363 RepID=UPI0022578DF8|nr:protein PLASTID MOVEMENT IMPAIRED 1-RELATED 1 [Diospyros lotus]XP_052200059.1 protein PLASTID MOVEMENT IMPAIRED 1-RELATED 1 [Diospyros lotus]XP_052200060.1 protein PLASTID MOVEMENT IMPAIRED 1-RELATED 1 [Diospyros lotus]XP_052200061.1 protein PLASTID MOVEMENT IMPAIRED 1-RELATED 1 [Diospyros lotus]
MMSKKVEAPKKFGDNSGHEKLLHDLEAINKALYTDRTRSKSSVSTLNSRSKSTGKAHVVDPKAKQKHKNEESLRKDKKSIWSWKALKAFNHIRHRRFNCCFSLEVHSIEGLPSHFDGLSVYVHWKRRDDGLVTRPSQVFQGIAEFEEQLTYTCSVYGSRNGPHHSAKYEAKHFLLYAAVFGAPGIDLGKHRVDLTRLLPITLEELDDEKNFGKWTTSFKLSGIAKGGSLNVSFGYSIIGCDPVAPSANKDPPPIFSLKQSNTSMVKPIIKVDQTDDKGRVHRAGRLPTKSSSSSHPVEDIKDLHEVLPISSSELSSSVSILFQKLDEEKLDARVDCKSELDVSMEPLECHKQSSDAGQENDERVHEDGDFSVVEHGIELSSKKQITSEEVNLKCTDGSELESHGCTNIQTAVAKAFKKETKLHHQVEESGSQTEDFVISSLSSKEQVLLEEAKLKRTDSSELENSDLSIIDTAVAMAFEEETKYQPQVEEIGSHREDFLISACISKENEDNTKESLMKDLESALHNVADAQIEVESTEVESDILGEENYMEVKSNYKMRRKEKSHSLDDVTDSIASEFLNMLGIEHNPFGWSSESEPESPRERLLRQFEEDALAAGSSLLSFDVEDGDHEEQNYEAPRWMTYSEDFNLSPMAQLASQVESSKTSVSMLEDLETEALMRQWGMNEKAFQHSPPDSSGGFGSPIDFSTEEPQQLPPLGEGIGPFVQTKNGGFLRSMNPTLFTNAESGGSLIMQVSSPVVVPAEMGSSIMEILQRLASVGIEKLSMQANKLMPLEDITGKTMQQIAWDAMPGLEARERQVLLHHESELGQDIAGGQRRVKGTSLDSSSIGKETCSEYVSLEDLAPLAMDKIEALSLEGLRIQSGMSDEDAPSNISPQSIGEISALEGKRVSIGESLGMEGAGGLHLLNIKDSSDDVDGLMGLSLTLDEWMKLDSGEIEDEDQISERTSKILAAHHANSMDLMRSRSKSEKRRGKGCGRKYGLFGNNFTVALMVHLRDPLRNYEPVGAPMLALIQVERVFVPPKPKIYSTVSEVRNNNEEDDESISVPAKKEEIEEPKKEETHEQEGTPQFKITELHVAGLKTEPGKKKIWGSASQQQSGSRWLLANGMGKNNKNPFVKSKAIAKSASPVTTTVQPGDTLWSISTRVLGTGTRWKELAKLNPHIRNPNILVPNETIRLC